MNIDTMTKTLLVHREEQMDVLWGAWVKQIEFDEWNQPESITGIYDTIWKEKKSDFPFITDLHVVLAYEAAMSESDKIFKVTLEIIDLDATNRIFLTEDNIVIPKGDIPLRWYKDYIFEGVIVREPNYYELSISIEQQYKQHIPLWIIAPKAIVIDEENDITTDVEFQDLLKKVDNAKK